MLNERRNCLRFLRKGFACRRECEFMEGEPLLREHALKLRNWGLARPAGIPGQGLLADAGLRS